MTQLTQLLDEIDQGQPNAADALLPLVYDDLRRLAQHRLANEHQVKTIQATELVHEAWLRLSNHQDPKKWNSRGHFFAAAAESMRRILVERARKRERIRHGAGMRQVDLSLVTIATEDSDDIVLALHEAIEKLALEAPEKAVIVKMRYFIGMGHAEIASATGISEPTVRRHWAYARAFLYAELKPES